MNCPRCGSRTMRAKQGYKTQTNSTEIEKIDLWVCTNPNCDLYCGTDVNNPEKIANRESEILQSVDY